MYYDNPGGRPQSAHMTRTGSRTGFGQRESIGNPLNLSLGRILSIPPAPSAPRPDLRDRRSRARAALSTS
jgi:hypothetical protein